ncbi:MULTISPECIES: MFS transporter [Pseudonocardia]|jgi:MFS family permease|uniref:Major facilitator superfamily MFS_1 n=1 Tax=Pseudonocardia dioxanivorans (strain ATCC 55486 / DSM 44775 / JCM 13855 / CB1190) TaxID=675635 RepID=F4CPR2_PSEUX|nr:MFS transporter [Pseudonocardia dioxanivorans]AEA26095.1 major facilitator superfamily MFS_1 [Pseudonocardia dioxanivorans CB1190]
MDVSGRRWVVWSVGLFAYLVGVMNRTTFGVAGLDAADRFGAAPAVLSGFLVLQLLVYAALQIPTGLLLDRFGARRLVVLGALVMAVGQLLLALASTLPLAIAARVLVGAGDALTFISVLSVVNAWFPARQVPVLTQLTGLLGQGGQVLSAVPFALLLHHVGWAPAFVSAAALGVAAALAVLAVFRNRPAGVTAPVAAASWRDVRALLRSSWTEPGTRLGLWTHTGTQFAGTVFALMWGVPYLVAGQGMSPAAAGALLTVLVVVGVVAGPAFGEFAARRPMRRSWLVIGVITTTAAAWTAVLLVPPPVPAWLLVLLVVVLAAGGPASMIGFDYARTSNPGYRQGTAVGIVNIGGFTASLLVTLAVGAVLGIAGGYTPGAFRVAWTVQYVVWGLALVGIVVARRRTRRRLVEQGEVVPPAWRPLRRREVAVERAAA